MIFDSEKESASRRKAMFRWIWVLVISLGVASCQKPKSEDEFVRVTNTAKNLYDRGDAEKAVPLFAQAVALQPGHPDALLNLANAHLLANQPESALARAQEVLALDRNSAVAHFIAGCANLRLGRAKEAVQHLQQAKDLDRTVNAVSFQLARAYQQLGQFEEAAQEFQEMLQFDPEHPAAHYNLSQVLLRLGRNDEAAQELAAHQKINAGKVAPPGGVGAFERSQYTQIRLPFKLEQPAPKGIAVTFMDATAAVLGPQAGQYQGPVGVVDLYHDGRNSLFVREGDGFRLLWNTNGTFQPAGNRVTGISGAQYYRCLVGDLNNDRYEDIIVLGDKGSHVYKLATNAAITDISRFSRLAEFTGVGGVLADLDFTAKLDLLAIAPEPNRVKVMRNLGNPYFVDHTTNSGVPLELAGARQLVLEDWNNDDLQDLVVTRDQGPPLLLIKQRGGGLATTNTPPDWPAAPYAAAGDLNNDLRPDLVLAGNGQVTCILNGLRERAAVSLGNWAPAGIQLIDYDNDGWLDLVCLGQGVRVWRNRGTAGFEETTKTVGLDRLGQAPVRGLAAADMDHDGDTDLVLDLQAGGLRLLRNDGANANAQLKVHLIGNKSNASGLGTRLEIAAGGLRLSRRINALPVEIGLGKYRQVDSLTAHWFDVNLNYADLKADGKTVVPVEELTLPTGSCPYFYAWDGQRFRFVTDILGASPVGLPVSENHRVEADPEEYVWIGNESMLPPKDDHYLLSITSELREVIYLDQAELVVVDHPPGTEVHTTGKMLPGKPYPKHELVTLHQQRPLLQATNHLGADITALLKENDQKLVSPSRLRVAQLRGLAEPHGVTLDFGPLAVERPLVLALTGWLRFGGGMVNVGAAHHPDLPFPFPIMEVETAPGIWQKVDVMVGVPAGKTKSIIVDLAGKLPSGSRRLRLSSAFELHWDRIALFEKRDNAETRITRLTPATTDLRWHGFGEYENLPWYYPLTPRYERPGSVAKWTIQPTGWCTRYGEARELIARTDNAFALINGGDELLMRFAVSGVPSRSAGAQRNFFLYSTGWEKDSDFHCQLGWQVEPLPWHGMDDQQYGRQPRPAFPEADALMAKYNTRWVGPYTLARKSEPGVGSRTGSR